MNSENYVVIQGWMCNELELKGNDLLVFALIYGFSQDGESEYAGGRNYIANTFNISLPTVDKALNNLVAKNYVEKTPKVISNVTFNTYKISLGVVKKLYGGSKETLHNIYNNKNNNKVLSKDNTSDEEFSFGKTKNKKPSVYENCLAQIYEYTPNSDEQNVLVEYLKYRLSIKDKPLYANMWKGMLKKLDTICSDMDTNQFVQYINDVLCRGWLSFYPLDNKGSTKSVDNVEQTDKKELKLATDKNGKPITF